MKTPCGKTIGKLLLCAVIGGGALHLVWAVAYASSDLGPETGTGVAAPRAALYPPASAAQADIAAALQRAAQQNKRVLVAFGANWCSDCMALDANFHRLENLPLLRDRFILVHVNVGDQGIDQNIELAARYGVPLSKGVPALAVLDGAGRVLHSQRNGEFESMRHLDPRSVHEFLARWEK